MTNIGNVENIPVLKLIFEIIFLQDHTLRVLRLDDHIAVYTLHGHCSPVTSAFIDTAETSCAGSGSQNGMLCVWDLFTGACVYSIQAHDGAVLSLTYSPSYVVSMGGDDKLCVWERVQGHLINSITLVSLYFKQKKLLLSTSNRSHQTCLEFSGPDFKF